MKRIFIHTWVSVVTAFLFPVFTFAMPQNFRELVDSFYGILSGLVPFIVSLTIVAFLYGVQKYILAGANEDDVKKGRDMMVYGIIGIFVMVSVWGLVKLVINTFFEGGVPNAPTETIDSNFIPQKLKGL